MLVLYFVAKSTQYHKQLMAKKQQSVGPGSSLVLTMPVA